MLNLQNLSDKNKSTLICCVSITIAIVSICLTVLIKGGDLTIKTENTEIQLYGKKQVNDAEYSDKKLLERVQNVEKTVEKVKYDAYYNPGNLPDSINTLDKEVKQLDSTATVAVEENEEVRELYESAIAEP